MKTLIFCAHPDDLEFSIPNLLIGLSQNRALSEHEANQMKKYLFSSHSSYGNSEIQVYAMTKGEMSSFTDVIKSTRRAAEIRIKELQKSQTILTGQIPYFLNFFDGYLKVNKEAIDLIEKIIEKHQPDIVLAPELCLGYYHHPDHVATGTIVFYAVRRIRNKGKSKPILFFFQAISNDWYFPEFRLNKNRIKQALAAHKSQQGILFAGSILKWIESLIHGTHVPMFIRGEALRWQPISGKIKKKSIQQRFKKMNIFKRMVYYFSKHFVDAHPVNYSVRYDNYFDGTIESNEY